MRCSPGSESLSYRNTHPSELTMRTTNTVDLRMVVVIAVALALGAAMRYPGGTPLSPSSSGYSPTQNFLSDLGMTVAYNGQPNALGAALFAFSLLLLVAVFGRSTFGFVRQYVAVAQARRWAIAGGLLIPLAGLAFAGVAVTPENRVMALHTDFTLLAWRVFALATVLLGVASLQADRLSRHRTVAWGILAVALSGYVTYLAVGPNVTTVDGLRRQVLAQKIIAVIALAILIYLNLDQHSRRPQRDDRKY